MSDERRRDQQRNLEHDAARGDPEAIAALERARARTQDQCAHRLVSRRLWLVQGTGTMRNDLFCLHCGINTEYAPDRETLSYDDCDTSREALREHRA